MERRFKEWIGVCCVALSLAGCAQGSKTLGRENVLNKEQVVETTGQLPSNNRVEETLTEEILDVEANDIEVMEIKRKMIEGLENLEIVKIKTAFPAMIDAVEKGSEKHREKVIEDLEVVYRIAGDVTLKEDIRTIQKLLKSSDSSMYIYAVHMLNDLSVYGIDYPYDFNAVKALEGWPQVYKEKKLFKTTKTWGYDYSEEVKGAIENVNIDIQNTYDLRLHMGAIQKTIDDECIQLTDVTIQEITEISSETSDIISEMRLELLDWQGNESYLRVIIMENEVQIRENLETCVEKLSEGKIKTEYERMLEYLDYCEEEVKGDDYNEDVVRRCIDALQQTLDDLLITVWGEVDLEYNRRYSGVTALMEKGPVEYDWIMHEIKGVYPDGGSPRKNYFGEAYDLLNEEKVLSDSTIGDLLENVVLPKQPETVLNQYKVDALQQLEQKYKGNIPVDEKEVISLLPDIILAPKGLNFQCFKEMPDIIIDNIGIVEQRGLHIRIKGIDGTKQKVTLQRPDGSKVWIDGWFSDPNDDSYWNCFIMDIVSLEEIKEYHLILE